MSIHPIFGHNMVYAIGKDNNVLYVGYTRNPAHAEKRLLKKNWGDEISEIVFERCDNYANAVAKINSAKAYFRPKYDNRTSKLTFDP